MTQTSEAPNKIIPNSFQTPNFFVDVCMRYLNGNEIKCVIVLARKTFGWQKRSDRISKPQLIEATGLNGETLDGCMNFLMSVGLVLRVHENNARNEGIEWALQLDDQKIRFDLLEQRKAEQETIQQRRTQKARAAIAKKRGGLSDNHTPDEPSVGQKTDGGGIVAQSGGMVVPQGGGASVGQDTQKPFKAIKKHMAGDGQSSPAQSPIFPTSAKPTANTSMGADAPARAFVLNERVQDFPQDCREGAQLMLEMFKIKPPKRPAANARGGTFALWINGIRELIEIAQEYDTPLPRAMQLTFASWNPASFRVSHPAALKKTMISALAQAALKKSEPLPKQPADESHPTFVPNPLPRPSNLPPSRTKPKRRN